MHTSRLWHARKLRKRVGLSGTDAFILIESAQCTKIAEVYWEQNAAAECEANARLIAAAPDLLEAAKELIEFLDESGKGVIRMDSFLRLRKAVRKASPNEGA